MTMGRHFRLTLVRARAPADRGAASSDTWKRRMQLQELAQVIRSKNAGPRRLTLDVIFASEADYQRAAQSPALSREQVAKLYRIAPDEVAVIAYPLGRAIKITLARPIMAGDPGDRDVYGAQQHAPLLEIDI
jgi:hypothetical protein